MKYVAVVLVVGMLSAVTNAQEFKAPDILIDSKLDYNWSGILVTKFRTLAKNLKISDPFSNKFEAPIIVGEKVQELLPEESKALMSDFGNAVGLNVLQAETEVSFHGLMYDVKGFKTNLKASQVLSDGLVVGTDFSASEVLVQAEKISFSLVIPGKKKTSVFDVTIRRPLIRASQEELVRFFAQIRIQDQKDFYKLQIQKASFDEMAKGLIESPDRIELDYERIEIPDLSIKVGNKTLQFSKDKIQRYLRSQHSAIKGIILAQFAETLQANTTQAAFKVLEQYKLMKEYWLSSKIMESQFQIGKFTSTTKDSSIQINFPADFCTAEKFKTLNKKCIDNKVTKISDSRLNQNLHQRSIQEMKLLMKNDEADFVASISEDYLNKLLVTTYDAGLWKNALDESGVELGPNKVTLRLGEKGETGTLLLDVIYKPTAVEKIMTGSKVIRFPLALDVSVRIEKHDEEAVVIVRLNDVDTSDETLVYGRPEFNIVSTVKDIPRFKGKVAQAIRSKISGLKSKDIIELRYPELNNLGLDKVDFVSDGMGRMNAIMRMDQ